jgi:hypothetical protein
MSVWMVVGILNLSDEAEATYKHLGAKKVDPCTAANF